MECNQAQCCGRVGEDRDVQGEVPPNANPRPIAYCFFLSFFINPISGDRRGL